MSIKNLFYLLLIGSIGANQVEAKILSDTKFDNSLIKHIQRYEITLDPSLITSINKQGLSGFGSSLTFNQKTKNGDLQFYCLTDRGPNVFGPKLLNGQQTIIFAEPNFHPFVGLINLKESQQATITNILPLEGSGRPLKKIDTDLNKELAISLNLESIVDDINGIDPEAITIDQQKNIWIGEEYGPSLIKINSQTGKFLVRLSPNKGLPDIIKYRQLNKGFESITTTPNGKIYAILEGVLDIKGETKNNAKFIRIIELDPTNLSTKMFAYYCDPDLYKQAKDMKIGDMVAIDNNNFLVSEQGIQKDNKMHNTIQLINIENANDITDLSTKQGKELEYATSAELSILNLVKKQKLIELRDYDWHYNKLEGLTIVDDNSIAITNDNDFELITKIQNHQDQDIENYTLDLAKKQLFYTNKPVDAKIEIKTLNQQKNELWLIKLAKPLSQLIDKQIILTKNK